MTEADGRGRQRGTPDRGAGRSGAHAGDPSPTTADIDKQTAAYDRQNKAALGFMIYGLGFCFDMLIGVGLSLTAVTWSLLIVAQVVVTTLLVLYVSRS